MEKKLLVYKVLVFELIRNPKHLLYPLLSTCGGGDTKLRVSSQLYIPILPYWKLILVSTMIYLEIIYSYSYFVLVMLIKT